MMKHDIMQDLTNTRSSHKHLCGSRQLTKLFFKGLLAVESQIRTAQALWDHPLAPGMLLLENLIKID